MKIINLSIENVKKIKAIDISPDSNTILITGGNEAGKSTVLDSIFMALTGKISEDPISHGKDKGVIVVDMGDYVVKRTLTKKRNTLEVTSQDGSVFKSPQKLLDGIIGNISFDPLEFGKLNAKEQKDTLLKLIGVDLDKYDEDEKKIYDERTIINRDVKTLEGKLKNYTGDYTKVDDKEIKIVDLVKKIADEKEKERRYNEIYDMIIMNKERVVECQKHIDEFVIKIQEKQSLINEYNKESIKMEKESDVIEFDYIDLEIQLNEVDEINLLVRGKKEQELIQTELEEKLEESLFKTDAIGAIINKKKDLLKDADMPIYGLSVSDDGVLFNGCAFSELSTAESLKVSLAIAMKMNPTLKVILVKSGNDLDPDNLKTIQEMVKAENYQLWLEKVDITGEIGLYIEEGEIVEPENYEY